MVIIIDVIHPLNLLAVWPLDNEVPCVHVDILAWGWHQRDQTIHPLRSMNVLGNIDLAISCFELVAGQVGGPYKW